MATTLVKGAIAVGTLATATGAGAAIYLNTGSTISQKLTSEGFTLISDENDYKFHLFEFKDNEKLKTALGLQTVKHLENVSNLKQWCDNNLKKWLSSDKENSIFENAKSWCVVPKIKTLGDKVKGSFYGDQEWQGKYAEFAKGASKTNFVNALQAEFTGVTFEEGKSDGGTKLKEWCVKVRAINTYDVDQHKSEVNLRAWCVLKLS